MSSGKPETWGIVGCGRVAENHAWAAREAGLRLTWACDLDRERAEALASRYGIARVTRDLDELRHDEETQLVSIATDHASHLEIARQFLHKPAVIVEKPLALPGQGAAAFLQAADRAKAVVGVASQHRCQPHVRRVLSALKDGALGDIDLVRTRTISARPDSYYLERRWRGTWAQAGGGALVNQGYHALDTMVLFFGAPEVLGARVWNRRPHVFEVEEGYHAALRFPGGVMGELFGSNAGGSEWDVVLEIFGTRGQVVLDLNHPGRIREAVGLTTNTCQSVHPPPGVSYYGTSHLLLMRELLHAVEQGTESPVAVEESLRTVDVIRRIYQVAGVESYASA